MTPWLRRIGLAIWVAALLSALAFYIGLFRFTHPSPKRYPVMGVDVSHHQGRVDWRKAGAAGVSFAYIKATEGADFKDPRFIENWIACKYAEVPRGAYHFFTFCRPAAEQAQNFLDTVPEEPQTLPPALDLEFSGNCPRVLSQKAMESEIAIFVKAIAKRYPGPPVFYATPDFYKRYLKGKRSHFPPHRLWLHNIFNEPEQSPGEEWTFWQYDCRGRIPGVRFPSDLNVFRGSAEEFGEFLKGVDKPTLRINRQ